MNTILQRYFRITSRNAFCSIGVQWKIYSFLLSFKYKDTKDKPIITRSISIGCKQFSIWLSLTGFYITLSKNLKSSVQGGDRYPENGTGQSNPVLPQNGRRKRRTGTAGVWCSCYIRKPAIEITELPYKSKTGTSGCGHRNRKEKKQGTDFVN